MRKLVLGSFALIKCAMVMALAATVVMVFTNAVLRYLFASGITLSEELSRWCFIWMIYLSGILLLKDDRHLKVTLIRDTLPLGLARLARGLSVLLLIGLCGLILRGSWLQMNLSWATFAPASGFSMGWLYLAGVVFGAFSLPILLYEFWLEATGRAPFPGYRSTPSAIAD